MCPICKQLLSLLLLTAISGTAPGQAEAFDDWVTLRDAGVVRQRRDYSCGAAALATLLTHYYRDPVSERNLLTTLLDTRGDASLVVGQSQGLSFADLAMLARHRGYTALGASLSYRDLNKLRVPVIVALDLGDNAHFSVLRKVDASGRVFLADPSWGNRQLGREEFLLKFARDSESDAQAGRVLIIGGPAGREVDAAYRDRAPRRVHMAPSALSRVP